MQSKTHASIFEPALMQEYFGEDIANVTKRTAVFFELWIDWRPNRIKLKRDKMRLVRKMLKDLGYKEFFHFQVRSNEARFCDNQIGAFALLSGLKEYER